MASEDRDGAAVRIPPPFVYLGAVLLGALLHGVLLALPLGLGRAARIGGTIVASAAGLALMGFANQLFVRTGQDPKPWRTTPEVISTGVYRFTRNPMYIGMALLQVAFATGLDNAWILILIPPVLFGVRQVAIRHEEAYLEGKFGDAYRDYKRSVRRWL